MVNSSPRSSSHSSESAIRGTTRKISERTSVRRVKASSRVMNREQEKPERDEPQPRTRPSSSGSSTPTPSNSRRSHPRPAQEEVKEKDQEPQIIEIGPRQHGDQQTQHGRQPRERSPCHEPTPTPGRRVRSPKVSHRTPRVSQDRATVRDRQEIRGILKHPSESGPVRVGGVEYRAEPAAVRDGHKEITELADRVIGPLNPSKTLRFLFG